MIRRRFLPLLVPAAALAVRIWYWLEMRDFPLFGAGTGDTLEYLKDAALIANGHWAGGDVFFHSSPVYSYFLAPFVGWGVATASDLSIVALVQLLVSAFTAYLVYLLARRFAGAGTALAAGFIYAFSPIAVFYDGELLADFILPAAITAAAVALSASRLSARRLLGAGVLIGLASVARPNCLLLLLPAAAVAWPRLAATPEPKGRFLPAAALILGTALVVAPFTVRNAVVGGDVVLISSNGGVNLWIGNNPQANGTFKAPGPWPSHLEASSRAYAEAATGRALKPSEVSAYFAATAIRYVVEDPRAYVRHVGRRLRLLASAYEIPNHMDVSFFKRQGLALRVLPFGWALTLPFGVAGAILVRREAAAKPALWLVAAYVASIALFFFVTGRYRFPAFPLLAVFAAGAPVAAYRSWHAGKRLPVIIAGAAALIATAAVIWPPPSEIRVGDGYSYHHLGGVYSNRGDYRAAVRAYEKAVAYDAKDSYSWNNLGLAYMRLGAHPRAEEALNRALALTPDNADTMNNYASLMIYEGKMNEARVWVGRALTQDPRNPYALVNLGIIKLASGDADGAMTTLEKAAAIDPGYANAYFNMALVYETQGDAAAARAAYRKGLSLEPNNAVARRRLAALGE